MKILAFVDVHGSHAALKRIAARVKKEKPDIIVCAGDITIFEQNIEEILEQLDEIGASAGKKVLVIHGNHETEEIMTAICKRLKNVFFFHKSVAEVDGFAVAGFGGGGFALVDKEFERWAKKLLPLLKRKKAVLVTHAPPYGTVLDRIAEEHAGCQSFSRFIKQNQPVLAICGHLHENAGKKQKMGKTLVVNPGPSGALIRLS